MSDFDRVFLRKSTPVPPLDEDFDDNDVDQLSDDEPPAASREGLPSSFRMRADSHYVDLLASRAVVSAVNLISIKDIVVARPAEEGEIGPLVESITSLGVVQPLIVRRRKGRYELIAGSKRLAAAIAAGLTEVPCLLREADDDRARALAEAENLRLERECAPGAAAADHSDLQDRAAGEIVDRLATIESCLNLFLDGERPLRERVAMNLLKAEAHRARWLAEAHGLLGPNPGITKKPIDASRMVSRALQGLEAESRLSNVKVVLDIDEPARPLVADERLMTVAVAGAVLAMLGALQGQGRAALKIRLRGDRAARQTMIQISQKKVALAEPAGGGPPLGLSVARRVMELHGGQVETSAGPRGGCIVTRTLPGGD